MSKSKIILVVGVLIALLPALGFPRAWESFFQVVAGLGIVLLSVWTTIDKKISLKAKAQMRQLRKAEHLAREADNSGATFSPVSDSHDNG